ncbi:LysM peptidoglycan-binding domain-containing protein [Moraxella sp. ZY21109]
MNTTIWQQTKQRVFKLSMIATAIGSLGLTACATTTTPVQKASQNKAVAVQDVNSADSEYLDADSFDSLEGLLYATDVRAVENDRLAILKHGNVWKRLPLGYGMGLDNLQHPRISAQRNWFISRQPYLDRLSARASRYLFYTVREAERRGLPTELALLPVIESSYDPAATSSAAAAGLWQFIPSTGRSYGLTQNSTYDGRRDVVASTQAAYDFLSALYNQFGSWELALAAYNAGPGTIAKAIKRNEEAGLPTDYWSLRLPKETMDYVPRFIAVAQIVKNQAAYGVDIPAIANRPHFREIILSEPMDLNYVSQVTGLNRAELYALNPGYRGDIIDYSSSMRLLIPADLNPNIDAQLKGKVDNSWLAKKIETKPTVNRVTGSIAGQFIPLPSVNPPTTTPMTTVNAQPIAPVEPPISDAERAKIAELLAEETSNTTLMASTTSNVNTVEGKFAKLDNIISTTNNITPPSETLTTSASTIAPAIPVEHDDVDLETVETNLTVAEKTGQEIEKTFSYPTAVTEKIAETTEVAQLNKNKEIIKKEKEVVVTAPKGKRTTYVVRAGDSLINIANRYGVNWRDIAEWNKIDANAALLVGTPLYLYNAKVVNEPKPTPTPVKKPEIYTVQSGDSLNSIANRTGLTVKQLAEYNGLTVTSRVITGQKLSLVEPKIPPKPVAPVKPMVKPTSPVNSKIATESYIVKRGENLIGLASRYSMTAKELADLTDGVSANSILQAGQKINVPKGKNTSSKVLETSANEKRTTHPTSHTVKSGETLTSIAQRYALQLNYLAELNGLERNSRVRAGQVLKLTGDVPKQVTQPKVTPAPKATSTSNANTAYVVKSGETLTSIAKREGLTIAELAAANGLTSKSTVRSGQRLVIPKATKKSEPAKEPAKTLTKKADEKKPIDKKADTKKDSNKKAKTVSYKVKSGDSLIAIAKKHGITPAELAQINGLKSNASLQSGTTIQVPAK